MTLDQLSDLVAAHPSATCGDRVVFGALLTGTAHSGQWSARIGDLHIIASDDGEGSAISVSSSATSHRISGAWPLGEAQTRWLQEAALHAPILCGAIVDLMSGAKREDGEIVASAEAAE